MLRIASAVLLATLVVPAASAQRVIQLGQTVNGSLTSSDPTLDDDSHYHLYTYHARGGERVRITLRSNDFDAFLAVGRFEGEDCDDDCRTDDDSGGGTDSRVVLTITEPGDYTIRANTLGGGETGDYSLTIEAAPSHAYPGIKGRIQLEGPVDSDLDDSDPVLDSDDSYYEDWSFRPDFTGEIEVEMSSEAFDTFLSVGTGQGDDFDSMESNDDGDDGEGTDSMLTLNVEAGRTYTIRANSLNGGETGGYHLVVRRIMN